MEITLNFCDWSYDIPHLHLLMFTFAPFKNDSTNKNLALLKKSKYK